MTTPPPPEVPEDWPRPEPSELEDARRVATEALSDDTARPATERLAGHYDPARRGAGTTFLELPPVAPSTITAADLHALTVLNAPVGALITRRLLSDSAIRAGIDEALAGLPTDADLAAADRSTFEAMEALAQAIHAGCCDPWVAAPNPWVTSAKLCTRKRPRLFPVRDRVVCKGLGLYGTPLRRYGTRRVDWQVFAFLIGEPDILHRLDELTEQVQTTHRVRCDAVPLRVLDVALWTWLPRA
ncbi:MULTISPECIES: DUF6308 family protein [unclassified Modestobacter]|uniref:DUF6308 family protein n=1 Tax=unclassified Modestobacter TaxID=2643866 RepID=UPI0022AA6CD4|nr:MULTISPECIES: DUF6308 family protein [unclassified Modestobacter]MCZ2826033.1 DUF6308 family protein [Modestobacter sp. VKM Ac-2981]MCZ2852902.1 DUF6308 family protein [Modestobacter sp. VKM Ac-2982]